MFPQLAYNPSLHAQSILGLLALSSLVQATQFPRYFHFFPPFLLALLLAFGFCLFGIKHVLQGYWVVRQ